ncbi:MAG: surface-adhesin E family protein [Sphingomonadaceae bacterium]
MRPTRPLLCCALLLGAALGPAQAAQWARLPGAKGNQFYVDKASIIKTDKSRKAWTLHSYGSNQTTPEGRPYRSVKALHLYACDDRTAVLLAQVFYPEAMGKGEPVENYKYEKFSPEDIVPDSPDDHALTAACK